MLLTHHEFRQCYRDFWTQRGHKEAPPIGLIPKEDPTTLFTGSGMQPLIPYLLGEPHPQGKRLYNIQPCLRAQDIEEVGDNRHTTAFEMVGNWSLGDYFKKEQLHNFFTFLTDKHIGLNIDPRRLYVTVFAGDAQIPKDIESIAIWQEIFNKAGIEAKENERILTYGVEKNWWSRSGPPDNMPVGELGGPDSEVFFDFGAELKLHEHSQFKDLACHPNCDCGRFVEIGNSVFMQYKKAGDKTFPALSQKNVDFGGGLERLLAAVNDDPDIFTTDLYTTIIKALEDTTGILYQQAEFKPALRVVADHMKAATFLIMAGVTPANKERGYVLRRLLRRAVVKMHKIKGELPAAESFVTIAQSVLETYRGIYFNPANNVEIIRPIIEDEIRRFSRSLETGLREVQKIAQMTGKIAFDLYQTYGFPFEITEELFREKGQEIDREQFLAEFNKHRELSRSASAGMFRGGLANHSEQTLKYHTATHLIHQALFDVIGKDVRQEGSNITTDRLRFDFYSLKKPEKNAIEKVQTFVNDKIQASLPVNFKIIPKEEALNLGAKAFFREKYPDMVKMYFVGDDINTAYSKELCGGPHVGNTKEIGSIEIYKLEKIGSNMYRIYAR